MPDIFYPISTIEPLDFDPVFLQRFSADSLASGTVEFLHIAEPFSWDSQWNVPKQTPLWNYNLHYFEFLFSLIRKWKDSGNEEYLRTIKSSISGWIEQNPQQSGGMGWDAYPISMRLKSWLSCYSLLQSEISQDMVFNRRMCLSIYQQYVYLANHLEKHLLANHYLENLTALVLCAMFFGDAKMESAALKELRKQCKEQILKDGMHCERSPMYHKIVLEDLMRVAAALRSAGRADLQLEAFVQQMLDAAYSMEEGLDRIPLFNDCGNNVAKGLDALIRAAEEWFGMHPRMRMNFDDGGFYIFKNHGLKLIVDAGAPGPKYNPGHAHSEALSFELFRDGKPVVANSGTYAYQCAQRSFFRSTSAHNTVMVNGKEQSACWGSFRVARRCAVRVLGVDANTIRMEMRDQYGNRVSRTICLQGREMVVEDISTGNKLTAYYHFVNGIQNVEPLEWIANKTDRCLVNGGEYRQTSQSYAVDYGKIESNAVLIVEANDRISWRYVCHKDVV